MAAPTKFWWRVTVGDDGNVLHCVQKAAPSIIPEDHVYYVQSNSPRGAKVAAKFRWHVANQRARCSVPEEI